MNHSMCAKRNHWHLNERRSHAKCNLPIYSQRLAQLRLQLQANDLYQILENCRRSFEKCEKALQCHLSIWWSGDFLFEKLLEHLQIVHVPLKMSILRLGNLLWTRHRWRDANMQRLQMIWIREDLTLQSLDTEEHNARLSWCSAQLHLFDCSLKVTFHVNTSEESLQRTNVWSHAKEWPRSTQSVECFVRKQSWNCCSP